MGWIMGGMIMREAIQAARHWWQERAQPWLTTTTGSAHKKGPRGVNISWAISLFFSFLCYPMRWHILCVVHTLNFPVDYIYIKLLVHPVWTENRAGQNHTELYRTSSMQFYRSGKNCTSSVQCSAKSAKNRTELNFGNPTSNQFPTFYEWYSNIPPVLNWHFVFTQPNHFDIPTTLALVETAADNCT